MSRKRTQSRKKPIAAPHPKLKRGMGRTIKIIADARTTIMCSMSSFRMWKERYPKARIAK